MHLTQSDTPEGFKQAVEGRIQAFANVHRLFVESRWTGAEVDNLVRDELGGYVQDGDGHVQIDGPRILLEPSAAQAIAVTLHELATNAAKYGSLSVREGKVRVECHVRQTDDSSSVGRKRAARQSIRPRVEASARA